jgi:hypothetical protein
MQIAFQAILAQILAFKIFAFASISAIIYKINQLILI